jgi:hypothetical protein
MPRSQTSSQRSEGIWPRTPVLPAARIAVLLAIAVAVIFALNRALDASGSRAATRSDTPVSAPAGCPQLAETFDSQRAACLRRRWSAMREMKPRPDAPQNAVLEDCLRSPNGDVAVPFKTSSCGQPKTPLQPLRAQN